MEELLKDFFTRNTVEVAKDLLGKIISVNGFLGRIVETEAYADDGASHGKVRTERSSLMFDTHGYIYVYLIYGMYHCLNFTTDKDKVGAVLIRAVEPLNRIEELKIIRKTDKVKNLCSGPGKLCQAFGISKECNGLELGDAIKVFNDDFVIGDIGTSSRIGIKENLDLQWRFFISGNEHMSKS